MNINSLLNHPPTPSSINSVYHSQSPSPSLYRTPTPSAGHRVQTASKVSKIGNSNSKLSKAMTSTGTTIQYVRFDKPVALDTPPNYPAYEITERPASLTKEEREELSRQQQPFNISVYPRPADGQPSLIGDYPRTVPYGGKPGAYGKQKRTGLHLFGYTFTVLQGPKRGEILQVLWDYKTGHVRLTAMFRALGHQKTEPKNAIDVNIWGSTDDKKLETVCYSVTGGNLGTQGYFMPYHCARELCLTFCWDIRWALTPVFGPTFARECLTRNDPQYGRYRISRTTFNQALQEHNAVVSAVNLASEQVALKRELSLLSSSDHSSRVTLRTQPTRTRRSSFRLSSDSSEAGETSTTMSSPPVSPKTIPASYRGWTPVNDAYPASKQECRDLEVTPVVSVAPPMTNSRRRPVPSDFSEDDSAPKKARFKHTDARSRKKKKERKVRKSAKKVARQALEEENDSDISFVPGLTNKEVSEDLKKYNAAKALLDFYHGNTSTHKGCR